MGQLAADHVPDNAHQSSGAQESRSVPSNQGMPGLLLALQGTAGNSSVNRMMVQRQPLGSGPGDAGGGGARTTIHIGH